LKAESERLKRQFQPLSNLDRRKQAGHNRAEFRKVYFFIMTMRRFPTVAIFLAGIVMLSCAQATEYWMASTDPYGRGPNRPDVAQDFLELFSPNAVWAAAAHQLTVVKFGPSFIDSAPNDLMREAFAALKRRGIAVGWEMGAVPPGQNCGRGEGYAGNTARSVARIKAAGGDLRYVAMDEPFWYGHHVDTRDTCRLSIGDLARGVADRLGIVRAVFPDVQVGDIEPVGVPHVDDYPEQIAEWAKAFQQATGHPLAFFHADIVWNGRWGQDLAALQLRLATIGVPVGVIINGDPLAKTDLDWTTAAFLHLRQVIDLAGANPESIIFQTWDDRPSRLLPEDQPGSLTNLVLEGSRPAAKIVLTPRRTALTGRITDKSGKPLADIVVDITARDVGGIYGLRTTKVTGIVPANAAGALFGLRINEECECKGSIDISIGQLQYRDGSAAPIVRSLQNNDGPYHLQGGLGVKSSINTAKFSVNPGAQYCIEVPMRVREQPNRAGYLALFFLDANGKEIRRDVIELQAAEQPIGKAVTDREGQFWLRFHQGVEPLRLLIQARTEANKSTRSTVAEIVPDAR
jgi:hypothetical protein